MDVQNYNGTVVAKATIDIISDVQVLRHEQDGTRPDSVKVQELEDPDAVRSTTSLQTIWVKLD